MSARQPHSGPLGGQQVPVLLEERRSEKRLPQCMAAGGSSVAEGADVKRRCHRGTRSSISVESKLMSSRNQYCNVSANSLFTKGTLHILFYNIQGLQSHVAELSAAIRVCKTMPTLVCLNETFLDESIEEVLLEGYTIVARRDRDDGRKGGGVAVYALDAVCRQFTMVEKSESCERVWFVMHTDTGPYLLGVGYRPQSPGKVASILSCEEEWQRLSQDVLGSILVGDVNVHHKKWLRYSSRNSAEGESLRNFTQRVGLRQLVNEPTREDHLLDLAFTDLDEARCKVVGKIADHKGLALALPLSVPRVEIQSRLVWQFGDADWEGLKHELLLHGCRPIYPKAYSA